MKKVLILSYYFPPLGMGGTQRAAKFVKYLPQFGWEPTVVTTLPIAYWAEDTSLLAELSNVRILRTESFDPQRLLAKFGKGGQGDYTGLNQGTTIKRKIVQKINQYIIPFFLMPDSKILWRYHVVRTVDDLCKKEHFDALVTTSPPHSTHLIGKKLARKHGLKWVADFRDGWAGGVVVHEPTFFHKWIHKSLQQSVLRNSQAVVSVSPGIHRNLKKKCEPESDKCYIITNGYDESDYPVPEKTQDSSRFVICHCGAITKFSHPETFLRSLRLLLDSSPDFENKMSVQFVGYDALGHFMEFVKTSGLEHVVHYLGYKSHADALKCVVNADALLLIARGQPDDTFIPSKTFEYLGAQKPVLTLSNVKDTCDFMEKMSMPVVSDMDNVVKISKKLQMLVEGHLNNNADASRLVRQFSRKNLTHRLANILNKLV